MKKSFITLVLVLVLGSMSFAKDAEMPSKSSSTSTQRSYVVKGQIVDADTNEVLTGVAVEVNNQKVYTDFEGNFEINDVCDDRCELMLKMISYRNKTVVVDTTNDVVVKIDMKR